jgi:hypothetical protein
LKVRQISAAIAVAATALVLVSTAAFADTLSVNLGGNWVFNNGFATGDQTSTLTPGNTSYSGKFSVPTTMVSECLNGLVLTLTYPTTTPSSSLSLTLANKLCQGSTATFTVTDGMGVFKSAKGNTGAVGMDWPAITFVDASGSSFLGVGGASPPVSATPELDSLLLFGSGALGLAGYGLTRLRAGRKQGRSA